MLKCSTYELWEKDNEFSVLYPEFIYVYKADEVAEFAKNVLNMWGGKRSRLAVFGSFEKWGEAKKNMITELEKIVKEREDEQRT